MADKFEPVKHWKSELKPAFPENNEANAIEFVKHSHPSKLVLDHGVRCTCCGVKAEDGAELLSNPEIPRVLCTECYTWAVMEVYERGMDS